MSCWQILMSLLFIQSGSRIPDAQNVNLIFSLAVTLYLTKSESRAKKFLTHSSHNIALSKSAVFAKKMLFFCKKMLTSPKLRGPWCMLTYQISSFQHSSNEFQTGQNEFQPPQNGPLKSPSRLALIMLCPLYGFDWQF